MLRFVEGLEGSSSRQELVPEDIHSWDLYRVGSDARTHTYLWILVFKATDDDKALVQGLADTFGKVQRFDNFGDLALTFTCPENMHVRAINDAIKQAVAKR